MSNDASGLRPPISSNPDQLQRWGFELVNRLRQQSETTSNAATNTVQDIIDTYGNFSDFGDLSDAEKFSLGLSQAVADQLALGSNPLDDIARFLDSPGQTAVYAYLRAHQNEASVRVEQTVRETETLSLSTQITSLTADLAETDAAVILEQTARADGNSALASDISTVSTTVAGHTATLTQYGASIDGIEAEWGVAINLQGQVTGLIRLDANQTESTFTVVVDKFQVAKTDGTGVVPIFQIGTVNGVSRVALAGDMLVDGYIAAQAIAAGAITTDKLDANAVTAVKIQAGAVTETQLADLSVANAKLANLSVTTGKMADLSVANGKLADLSVDSGKLADLAVSNAKLADLAVSNGKLDDLAVDSGKLADLAVSNGKIANLAVNAGKIEDAAIITSKIAASAVVADKIAANAIAASKLIISDTSNMIPDDGLLDTDSWFFPAPSGGTWSLADTSGSESAARVVQLDVPTLLSGTVNTYYSEARSSPIPCDPDKSYAFGAFYRATASAEGRGQVLLQWYDASDVLISGSTAPTLESAVSTEQQFASQIVTPPATARFMRFRIIQRYDATTGNLDGTFRYYNMFIRPGVGGEVIVDGAITATKIAAGTITADKLNVSTLSAIAADVGTLTAGTLESTDGNFVIDLDNKTITIET